jgi:hypothetical protein
LRFAVIVIAFAYIWGTPFVRQVLHIHQPYARMWVMFSGYARETCVVELEQTIDGRRQPLDRFALMGIDRPRHAPSSLRFVEETRRGEPMLRQVCRKLGPDAEVYARTRCLAGNQGWREVRSLRDEVCSETRGPRR